MDDIVEEEALQDYGFGKGDLRRLFVVLDFPQLWVCQNGSRFPGETAFLLLLRRLRYETHTKRKRPTFFFAVLNSEILFDTSTSTLVAVGACVVDVHMM